MTRKQVIRTLIKDYERAIEEGWSADKIWEEHLYGGICWAARQRYEYYLNIKVPGNLTYWCETPRHCESDEYNLNTLTARLFLLHSLND